MKRKYLKSFAYSLMAISLITVSCKKDDKKNEPTKTELLTGNNWVTTRIEIEPAIDFDGDGTQENNLTPYFDPCDLDDFLNLKTDKTYIIEEGASKCDPNDPQVVETGTWTLSSNNTRLVLSSGGSSSDYLLKTLTANKMVTAEELVLNGVTYTITTTYD